MISRGRKNAPAVASAALPINKRRVIVPPLQQSGVSQQVSLFSGRERSVLYGIDVLVFFDFGWGEAEGFWETNSRN
jgi:hypothetical protein